MVSQDIITSMIFAICAAGLSVVVPFIIIYFMSKKRETGMFASFGLGLLAYFWSQYLLPIPILYILTNFKGFMTIYREESYSVIYILITAFMLSILAGLGRLWAVWLMNRRTPSLYRASSSAVGFAAFKAMSVIASYLTYIRYVRLLNSGGRQALVDAVNAGQNVNQDEAIDNMIAQLTSANVFDIIMEGVNAILFMLIEVALIIIIYKGMIKKKTVIAAVISTSIGFAYTFITMLIGKYINVGQNKIIYHSFLFACGLVSLWIIIRELKLYRQTQSYNPDPFM